MSEQALERWDCHVHVFEAQAPVQAGHYQPADAPLHTLQSTASVLGVSRFVLVQPSVYGHDHQVMLRALAQAPGQHRGVAVLPADISDTQWDELHAAGVRGTRFNLVSPVGHAGPPWADLARLTPGLRARGWHVQWYVQAEHLPRLVQAQQETGLCFVLDHMAGLQAQHLHQDRLWQAVAALAAGGAWVKLSGWYRLGSMFPHTDLYTIAQRVHQLFGPRCLWGSDWPHTSFAPGTAPAYAGLNQPLLAALGETAMSPLWGANARSLYLDESSPYV